MIQRACKLSKTNSFFLFGPRGSGKISILDHEFSQKDSLFVDLLNIELFDQFILDPTRFEALIDLPEHKNKRVIIDEVQKLPKLLDVAHTQIQKRKRQFILEPFRRFLAIAAQMNGQIVNKSKIASEVSQILFHRYRLK